MSITFGPAIAAGAVATVVMTVVMYMGGIMGMKMDIPMMLGTMFLPKGAAARVLGLGLHFMMGIGFFLVYAAVLDATGIESNIVGWMALFGVVHALIAGMAMGMMPAMHPRMRSDRSLGAAQAALPAPGFFGLRLGAMAPMALIILHVVYGAVAGALYVAVA